MKSIQVDRITENKIEQWRHTLTKYGPRLESKRSTKRVLRREAVLPETFNWANETDAEGNSLLMPTKDQLSCGSCYAFCSTQMLSERLSIATNGEQRVILSDQDIVSSGPTFEAQVLNDSSVLQPYIDSGQAAEAAWYALEGCDGGLLVSAANYLTIRGVPTEEDVPYNNSNYSPIASVPNYYTSSPFPRYFGAQVQVLTAGLEDGIPPETVDLPDDILASNNQNMMVAIFEDGPIITGLNVYTDFFYYPYTGDVYQKQDQIVVNGQVINVQYEGGHAVAVVGWGIQDNGDGTTTPYWVAQNSWGESWGLGGFFLIERGVNMVDFEYDAVAVTVDLGRAPAISTSSSIPYNPENNNVVWIAVGVTLAVLLIATVAIGLSLKYRNRKNKTFIRESKRLDTRKKYL